MAIPTNNFTIEQGDDKILRLTYEQGPQGEESPVDLTQGWQVRMDIRTDSDGQRVWTFNSDDIADAAPEIDSVGQDDNEIALGQLGQINIVVPRYLTLSGGAIFDKMATGSFIYGYDIFLRDPDGNQKKILRGTITVNPSVTLWK